MALALVFVLVLAVAGCSDSGVGGDDAAAVPAPGTDGTTATTATTPTTAEPATTAPAPASDTTTTTPRVGGSGGDCAEEQAWGTGARSAEPMVVEDVYLVRAGRHGCYDRVVFDVNGVVAGPGTVGFHVAYAADEAAADGSGQPVPTEGDAALEVVVRAPALGYGTSGHQPGRTLGRVGDDLVTTGEVAGWASLRQVAFAGSFEGQTTFAVGVDRRLPFRAGASEVDGVTHVYVDIAHPQ